MARKTPMAKLCAPRLFGVVARTRLFAELDANRGRPLIWLDSPPGSGKTSLVASYLDQRDIPMLWYQVDAGDIDPAMVFHYLGAAARDADAAGSTALPSFVSEHLRDLPAFARTFFRALFAGLKEGTVLVFDNHQEVNADAPLNTIIRAALVEVPQSSSILILSRTEPSPDYALLAARGAMLTLHWDSLRLTLEETREIAAGRGVRDAWLLQALHQQSDGWAAGVTLMLERLRNAPQDGAPLPRESREAVFNYFAALLFRQLPAAHGRAVSLLSFLPYSTDAVATEVTECIDIGRVLDDLYRRRMFVNRTDGPVPSYRFHALFRAFLHEQAMSLMTEGEIRHFKGRAAQALEHTGDLPAAIDLLIESCDWPRAVAALLQFAAECLRTGRHKTLEHWIHALPEHVREADATILYWLGIAQGQTNPQVGTTTLERALAGMEYSGDLLGKMRVLTALLKSGYVGHLQFPRLDGWLDAFLELLPAYQAGPPDPEVELSYWGVLCCSLQYIRPWHPLVKGAPGKVLQLLSARPYTPMVLPAATAAIDLAKTCGDFDTGEQLMRLVVPHLDHPGNNPVERVWFHNQAGYLRFMQGRYEEARQDYLDGCRHAERNDLRALLPYVKLAAYMVEFRTVGWETACATLKEVELLREAGYTVSSWQYSIYQARLAEHLGEFERAADLAAQCHAAIVSANAPFMRFVYGMICAEVLLQAGRHDDAAPMIDYCRSLMDRAPILELSLGALRMVEAYQAHCMNNKDHAACLMRVALRAAQSGNSRCRLRFQETGLRVMLPFAFERNIEVDFIRSLAREFRLKPASGASDDWPWPIRVVTLASFEVRCYEVPLEFPRKTPRKTLALLKALIAHGGAEVPESWLCDALWGDDEADAAREALGITVLRLRKLLGSNESLVQKGGHVSLNRALVWVDVWRFETYAALTERAGALRALALYRGNFLPGDEGESWSVTARERLRGKFIHILAGHGVALESDGDTEQAMSWYLRGIDADPIVESFYQGLMRCYQRAERHTEAISAYRRLRQTLSAVLGVAPSGASRELYDISLRACGQAIRADIEGEVVPLSPRRKSR